MRERPILFNDAMVRAILSGAKTQTRRPLLVSGTCAECFDAAAPHNAPDLTEADGSANIAGELFGTDPYLRVRYCEHNGISGGRFPCPFGAPGEFLWVRECFALGRVFDESRAAELPIIERDVPVWFRADGGADESWANRGKWRPSIHMPRWASRLTLRVTDVRVERVQDITEADAMAEGFDGDCPVGYLPAYTAGPCRYHFAAEWPYEDAQSWTANPWVWVVSFERVEVARG